MNLDALDLLKGYIGFGISAVLQMMLTCFQIRIVKDNVSPKSKPHRGYAFIVYEREKDMKGTWITSAIKHCYPPY